MYGQVRWVNCNFAGKCGEPGCDPVPNGDSYWLLVFLWVSINHFKNKLSKEKTFYTISIIIIYSLSLEQGRSPAPPKMPCYRKGCCDGEVF